MIQNEKLFSSLLEIFRLELENGWCVTPGLFVSSLTYNGQCLFVETNGRVLCVRCLIKLKMVGVTPGDAGQWLRVCLGAGC